MLKKFANILKTLRQSRIDSDTNKQLIAEDRFKNKYYQALLFYYKTKRICEYSDINNKDYIWEEWLRGNRKEPYSKKELDEIYKIEDLVKSKGKEFDLEEERKMELFRKQNTQKNNQKSKEQHQQNTQNKV